MPTEDFERLQRPSLDFDQFHQFLRTRRSVRIFKEKRAALSLGLGSTIIGMIRPVVEQSKELRARYGIPKDNRVLTSLILDHPKYRYRQGIRRDLAGVQFNRVAH